MAEPMTDAVRASDLYEALRDPARANPIRFIRVVLASVRADERERCARVADAFATGAEAMCLDAVLRPSSLEGEPALHRTARQEAENIAAAIRQGTP